ncbi:hypothetical protein BH10PSE17_BH10PSE17_13460 [soil metagenome]
MKFRLTSLSFALALLFTAAWQPAQAQSCAVGASQTAFGYYSPSNPIDTDTIGNVNVTCTALVSLLVSYSIKFGQGTYGTFTQRQLGSGTQRMNYQLYTNLSRTTVWGDGSASTGFRIDGYLLGLVQVSLDYPVYGRIPAGQNVGPGAYTDSIQVTLTY